MRRTLRLLMNPPLNTKSRRSFAGPAAGVSYISGPKAIFADQLLDASDERLLTELADPVIEEMTLLHCVKGASVT